MYILSPFLYNKMLLGENPIRGRLKSLLNGPLVITLCLNFCHARALYLLAPTVPAGRQKRAKSRMGGPANSRAGRLPSPARVVPQVENGASSRTESEHCRRVSAVVGFMNSCKTDSSLATYRNRVAAPPLRCNVHKVLMSKCCQRSFRTSCVPLRELSSLRCQPGWSGGGLQRLGEVVRFRLWVVTHCAIEI